MTGPVVQRLSAVLLPDPARTVAQLFLPGEEAFLLRGRSRSVEIVARILALTDAEVRAQAEHLLVGFTDRHVGLVDTLLHHATVIASRVGTAVELSPERQVVLGATFTAEYALEGAALCNPSAVPDPDQSGLGAGEVRLAVSLRAIGEGHISSIGFATAVVGPGREWRFEPRTGPPVPGTVRPGVWQRTHLAAVLEDGGRDDELGSAVLRALPESFEGPDLDAALARVPHELLGRPRASETMEFLRGLVSSTYEVTYPLGVSLAQRVLLPSAAEERRGMEDARFTRFVDADGTVDYRATYTAYDGAAIAPRILVSADLRTFRTHRLAGPAARNKGMALFPRKVGGRFLALCRSDGESTSVARSDDGLVWGVPTVVHRPVAPWEVVQVGNCGPPIETPDGWLVLTHGVGPMRVYSIGAVLLDLDDPTRLLAHTAEPLLVPGADERDGYVPNVVYSCGGFLHDGTLWIPYGVDDVRVSVAVVELDGLLASMTRA